MKRVYVTLVALLFPLCVYSSHPQKRSEQKRAFILTVPKSGTHLLKKILCLIMDKDSLYFTNIGQNPYEPPFIPDSQFFIFNHLYPGFSIYREADPNKYIKVVLIRDPRDVVVSFMMHMEGKWGPWFSQEVTQQFQLVPQQEKLAQAILFPDEQLGLRIFFREALEWMKDPSVLVVRFEDIVGPQGGGDRMTQEKTLRTLVKHLGFCLSKRQMRVIADHAFGPSETGETTFRVGQIGTWPQYFTERDKELFKLVMGEELIQMGYEKNNNW